MRCVDCGVEEIHSCSSDDGLCPVCFREVRVDMVKKPLGGFDVLRSWFRIVKPEICVFFIVINLCLGLFIRFGLGVSIYRCLNFVVVFVFCVMLVLCLWARGWKWK